jgi:hypothetical protein
MIWSLLCNSVQGAWFHDGSSWDIFIFQRSVCVCVFVCVCVSRILKHYHFGFDSFVKLVMICNNWPRLPVLNFEETMDWPGLDQLLVQFGIGLYWPNFDLKNMILTYTKDFSLRKMAQTRQILKENKSKLPYFYYKFY